MHAGAIASVGWLGSHSTEPVVGVVSIRRWLHFDMEGRPPRNANGGQQGAMAACLRVSRFRSLAFLLGAGLDDHGRRKQNSGFIPREQRYGPAPTSRSLAKEIAALSLSVPDPNQALILMRCVVGAEEYNIARHALAIPASSQPARDFGDAWAGAQRSSSDSVSLEVPKPTTRESPGPEMP
jgi:hypothetical protein